MSQEKLMAVLLGPHVSEKSARVAEGESVRVPCASRCDAPGDEGGSRADVRSEGCRRQRRERCAASRSVSVSVWAGVRTSRRLTFVSRRARASISPAPTPESRLRIRHHGIDQSKTDVARPAFPGFDFALAPAQGRPGRVAGCQQESHWRAQSLRPPDCSPSGRRSQAELSSGRLPAQQGWRRRAKSSASNTIPTARRIWRWCCTRMASVATSSRRRAWQRVIRSCRDPRRRSSRATPCSCAIFRSVRRFIVSN